MGSKRETSSRPLVEKILRDMTEERLVFLKNEELVPISSIQVNLSLFTISAIPLY